MDKEIFCELRHQQ